MVQLSVYLSVCLSTCLTKWLTNHPTDRLTNWPTIHWSDCPSNHLTKQLSWVTNWTFANIIFQSSWAPHVTRAMIIISPLLPPATTMNQQLIHSPANNRSNFLVSNVPYKRSVEIFCTRSRTHSYMHALIHARCDTSQHYYHGRWTHPFWKLIKINF